MKVAGTSLRYVTGTGPNGPTHHLYSGIQGPYVLQNIEEVLELLQIPKKYFARCLRFPFIAEANVNAWLAENPEFELQIDNSSVELRSAQYQRFHLPDLHDWFALDELLISDNQFSWYRKPQEQDTFAVGYTVTYLEPSLRVDATVVCPKTNCLWLWPTNRIVKTRNEGLLSVSLAVGEIASEAVALADTKLDYCDKRYALDVATDLWLDHLWNALRFSQKLKLELLTHLGSGQQDEFTLGHKVLQHTKHYEPAQRRKISLAIGHLVTEGTFK